MRKQVLMLLALFAMVSMSVFADQNWGGYFVNMFLRMYNCIMLMMETTETIL